MKLSSVSSRYSIHRADARIVRRLASIPEVISVVGGTAALDPLEFHRKDIYAPGTGEALVNAYLEMLKELKG